MSLNEKNIGIRVELDKDHVPERIVWHADDMEESGSKDAKAMIMAFWDPVQKGSLRLDLWTKDMPVDDMKRFCFEVLMTMGDTLQKSTGEEKAAKELQDFVKNWTNKIL